MIRIWTVLKEGKPNDMFLCCENTRLWMYLWAQFWVCTYIKWITNQDNFTLSTFKKWKSFFLLHPPSRSVWYFFSPTSLHSLIRSSGQWLCVNVVASEFLPTANWSFNARVQEVCLFFFALKRDGGVVEESEGEVGVVSATNPSNQFIACGV